MTLYELLQASDNQVINHLINLKPDFTDNDNYFFFPNENSNMLLLAHLDTVRFKKDEPVKISNSNGIITNQKGILGADDRAGMYIAFQLMSRFNVLITNYEESGGQGAIDFCDQPTTADRLKHIDLIIALDRKGACDYVTYREPAKEVNKYFESFGFTSAIGSYNDAADLTDALAIPHANVSVGYFDQHTARERLDTFIMNATIRRLERMADNPIDQRYSVEQSERFDYGMFFNDRTGKGYGMNYGYGYDPLTDNFVEKEDTPARLYLTTDEQLVALVREGFEDCYATDDCPHCGVDCMACSCGELEQIAKHYLFDHEREYLEEQGILAPLQKKQKRKNKR